MNDKPFGAGIFFYFSTPCIQNVNNTGTKYARIMKKNCILKRKTQTVYTMFNLLAPELFFLILAHPVYKNMNNTGTKYVKIMKQTAF